MKKVIFISIFIISLVVIACSSVPPTDLPPTVDIKNSKVSFMQDNMEQQSSSFHHFLMGNMDLFDQNFDSALSNLKKAGDLSKGN